MDVNFRYSKKNSYSFAVLSPLLPEAGFVYKPVNGIMPLTFRDICRAMYDLSTKKEKRITTNPSASYYPAIYGNMIVWDDDRNGNWDIYVYDLATGQESHTTDKLNQYYPDIYGDKIVWTDMRNGNADIYMGTLSTSPIAAFSASPTSGKAPLKVKFTDKSTGSPTSWKWSFGDGTDSTSKSPAHTYSKAGKYTVSLTVKNAAGSNTKTVSGYIKVSKK